MNRHQIKLAAQNQTLIQFGLGKLANAAQEVGAFRKFMAGEHGADFAKRMMALRGAGMGAAVGGLGGAVVGAASNEDDRFGGAIKGGLGGAAVGGLAGGAHGYIRGNQALAHPEQGANFLTSANAMRDNYLGGKINTRAGARSVSGFANLANSAPIPAAAKSAELSPAMIGALVGTGVGGVGGYLSADSDAATQEKLMRALGGGALGALGGGAVGYLGFDRGQRTADTIAKSEASRLQGTHAPSAASTPVAPSATRASAQTSGPASVALAPAAAAPVSITAVPAADRPRTEQDMQDMLAVAESEFLKPFKAQDAAHKKVDEELGRALRDINSSGSHMSAAIDRI